jgi:hypothetical protein
VIAQPSLVIPAVNEVRQNNPVNKAKSSIGESPAKQSSRVFHQL